MAEISRESALIELKTFPINCLDFNEKRALAKAISDMEKLQKIEEVITSMENTDDEVMESFAFREIEQIVKEVE